ncbi:hypothetical protein [Flavobacterium ajazii]|uniref:hypothetical protein n=1 Tax=Flavobacterium ajazii TaxID=2692318 RepID=UPI0013D5A49F|nr:hypothetical protein [Flavobacterium ajazii]
MKKIICFFSVLVLVLASCSSDDNSSSEDNLILPKTISSTNPEFPQDNKVSTITYDGNKIMSIASLGSKTVFTYDGNRIIKQEVFDVDLSGNQIKKTSISYTYENGKLKTRILRKGFENAYPEGQYIYKSVYTHISDTFISYIYYTVNANTNAERKSSEGNLTYKDGNLIKEQEIEDSSIYTREYEYDTKKNPLKNILGFNLLLNETIFSINNISKTIRTETEYPNPVVYLKSYIYDDNGYPTKRTSFASDGESVEYTEEYSY